MKAVVWMNVGHICLTDMPEPKIQEPTHNERQLGWFAFAFDFEPAA
jgi:hypothetical protein